MSPDKPRTIVDFLDRAPAPGLAHKATVMRINGTEVLVEKNTISLDFSDNDVTKVTLTLLPTEVHFVHAEPETDESPSAPSGRA